MQIVKSDEGISVNRHSSFQLHLEQQGTRYPPQLWPSRQRWLIKPTLISHPASEKASFSLTKLGNCVTSLIPGFQIKPWGCCQSLLAIGSGTPITLAKQNRNNYHFWFMLSSFFSVWTPTVGPIQGGQHRFLHHCLGTRQVTNSWTPKAKLTICFWDNHGCMKFSDSKAELCPCSPMFWREHQQHAMDGCRSQEKAGRQQEATWEDLSCTTQTRSTTRSAQLCITALLMKTEIVSSSPTITGSLIKELTKQAGQTQPCIVLVSMKVLQRNRNLQHPDTWWMSWLQNGWPNSANKIGLFQELSPQGAPGPHQHIQNPIVEHETWFSLFSQYLLLPN